MAAGAQAIGEALHDAVRLIEDGVGCVLLRAEGRKFCVDGDIRAFAAAPAPAEFLGQLASAMAVELASGPTAAFGRSKRLLVASDRATLAGQLDAEAGSIAECADHPQGRAGVAAFTAGRKPVFH